MHWTTVILLLLGLSGYGHALSRNRDQRIRRDIVENLKKDDPKAKCRNGGIFAGGMCHCIHPHTGDTCQDYACVHGMSVGRRYDQNSLFFNRPCICDEGWSGDLCEYHLTDRRSNDDSSTNNANAGSLRCSGRGEWINDHCQCIGHFFGSECQYTSRCDQGIIRHGRCICHKDWEGDYCHQIVCHHGYPDLHNRSLSCVCPAQYQGTHCDACLQTGPKIDPYPKCTVNLVPHHARITRKKTQKQIKHRLIIILIACSFLGMVALVMAYMHFKRSRNKDSEEERARVQELSERTAMLAEQARKSGETITPAPGMRLNGAPKRKRSITNPFRITRRDLPESNHLSLTKKERRRSLQNPFRTKRSNSTCE